jgi:hypothetical protein
MADRMTANNGMLVTYSPPQIPHEIGLQSVCNANAVPNGFRYDMINLQTALKF